MCPISLSEKIKQSNESKAKQEPETGTMKHPLWTEAGTVSSTTATSDEKNKGLIRVPYKAGWTIDAIKTANWR